MKRIITLMLSLCISTTLLAQKDSAAIVQKDTFHFGNITIIKDSRKKSNKTDSAYRATTGYKSKQKKRSNISTNWLILDLGFCNYNDKTNYALAGTYLVNRPGYPSLNSSDFRLKTGKSINVNLWFFMQKLNLVKHYINLKYGLGLEMNNYRYKSSISYRENGTVPYTNTLTNAPFIFRDSISFSKNKLAADYITIPFMVNFRTNPNSHNKGLSLSAGISAGYLYSERNKQKSNERGKQTGKGEYDLEDFKLSYIGELGLGPVRLYGSYAPKSFYSRGLDMRPYTIGIRLSNW